MIRHTPSSEWNNLPLEKIKPPKSAAIIVVVVIGFISLLGILWIGIHDHRWDKIPDGGMTLSGPAPAQKYELLIPPSG